MEKQKERRMFPLSSKYNEDWIKKNSLGENVLFNLESLCEIISFKPGMRVLDLGCGKAISAIFLAKEFGVKVWAIDHRINPTNNYKRICEMECDDLILPLQLNVRALPFPENYFDAIIAVDSFMYYGTDTEFTNYITRFLKPEGQLGIVDICYSREINYLTAAEQTPEEFRNENLNFVHSLGWWYRLWDDSGILKITNAEIVPNNSEIRREYIRDYENSPGKDIIAEEISQDKENLINIFRMVALKDLSTYKDYPGALS